MSNNIKYIKKLSIIIVFSMLAAGCYTGIEGSFETDDQLQGPGETAVRSIVLSGPSKAACLQAVVFDSNNTFGIIDGNMNDIVLPPCEVAYDDGTLFDGTITYSLAGLPDGLGFDADTRTISITNGPDFSQRIELTYSCTATTPDESLSLNLSKASVTLEAPVVFYLNDYDEDGLVDYTEYINSDGILLHKFGWFKVNETNNNLYCVGTVFCDIPNGITVNGFDFTDPTDAVGDFDNDGILNETELNNGSNPYVAEDAIDTWTMTEYNFGLRQGDYVVSADLDNDGDHDLIVGDDNNMGILTLVNQGSGNMSAPVWRFLGSPVSDLIAGDYNQDGFEDIVVSLATQIDVLLSDGDGTYTGQPLIAVGANLSAITAADFNNDGVLDLAVVDEEVENFVLKIMLGIGNGSFAAPIDTTVGSTGVAYFVHNIIFGDIDADNNMDLVISRQKGASTGNIHVFLGNGDGTFQGSSFSTRMDPDGGGPDAIGDGGPFFGGSIKTAAPLKIALADLDGDGYLDYIVPQGYYPPMSDVRSWVFTVYWSDGAGSYEATTHSAIAGLTFSQIDDIVVADFDGDNDLDLGVVYGPANLNTYVLANLGDGDFVEMASISNNVSAPLSLVAVDLNQDGKIDLATASDFAANMEIEVLLND